MSIKSKWRFGPLKDVEQFKLDQIEKGWPELYADPLEPSTIREVRDRLDKTQEEFGELIGVTTRTIKAWEHPRREASEARNCTGPGRKMIIVLARCAELLELLDEIEEKS